MRPADQPAALTTLQALVAAISDDRLRALVIELGRDGAAARPRLQTGGKCTLAPAFRGGWGAQKA